MFTNMFWFDRALRFAIGLLMLTLAFIGSEWILYGIGGVLALTGITGFCPLLALFGHKDEPQQPIARKSSANTQNAMA